MEILNQWAESSSPPYKSYTLLNYKEISHIRKLPEEKQFEIEVVGNVFPFKTNNYVAEQLIDWENIPNDPIFVLTFPQKKMLKSHHFKKMATALKTGADKNHIQKIANEIRFQLNPHPAGQMEFNVPQLKDGTKLYGMQHKYKETVLFFPSQGQTCHAYCTFCFRWPQFVGMEELKFAMHETELLVRYLREHPEVSDVLFTGGDPMIMKAKVFSRYIDALLDANLPNLKNIRIGSKALAYWPYKFISDDDATEMLELFNKVTKHGKHLAFMAHFNHPAELSTDSVKKAITLLRNTGAEIRTQSPILRHINDNHWVWAEMWAAQVKLGLIPYYMFIERDTGAQHFFSLPLVKAHKIFTKAYRKVSGLARTVRGPSMSAMPGKVHILGTAEIAKKKALVLRFLQGRNPKWVHKPFLAEYNPKAKWLNELKPFNSKKFFFEDDLNQILNKKDHSASKIIKRVISTKNNNKILTKPPVKKKTKSYEHEITIEKWWWDGKRRFS